MLDEKDDAGVGVEAATATSGGDNAPQSSSSSTSSGIESLSSNGDTASNGGGQVSVLFLQSPDDHDNRVYI